MAAISCAERASSQPAASLSACQGLLHFALGYTYMARLLSLTTCTGLGGDIAQCRQRLCLLVHAHRPYRRSHDLDRHIWHKELGSVPSRLSQSRCLRLLVSSLLTPFVYLTQLICLRSTHNGCDFHHSIDLTNCRAHEPHTESSTYHLITPTATSSKLICSFRTSSHLRLSFVWQRQFLC